MAVTIIVAIIAIFAAGAAVGAIALVSWGIHREERDFSLTREAPTQVSHRARTLTGLYVRQRTDARPAVPARSDIYA
jgi:hypothetical protein